MYTYICICIYTHTVTAMVDGVQNLHDKMKTHINNVVDALKTGSSRNSTSIGTVSGALRTSDPRNSYTMTPLSSMATRYWSICLFINKRYTYIHWAQTKKYINKWFICLSRVRSAHVTHETHTHWRLGVPPWRLGMYAFMYWTKWTNKWANK